MIHGLNNFHHMKPPLLPIIVMIYLDSYVIIMHGYATPSMIQWSQASIVTNDHEDMHAYKLLHSHDTVSGNL